MLCDQIRNKTDRYEDLLGFLLAYFIVSHHGAKRRNWKYTLCSCLFVLYVNMITLKISKILTSFLVCGYI